MKPSMLLDAFWVLVTRFVMRAANLLVFMLLARGLDQEEFGQYGYVMASVLMLSVIFDIGLRQSSGLYLGKPDADQRRIVANVLAMWLVLGAFGSLAMAGVMVWGGFDSSMLVVMLAAATLAPTLLIRMGQGTFLGLGRMRALNQSELASRALLLVGTFLAWLFDMLTIEFALALLFLSYAGAAGLLVWQIRDLVGWPRIDVDIARPLLVTGMTFAGGIIGMIMLGRVGVWIVNALLGSADVGSYFAVMRLSEMIAEVATAVGVVIFSHGVRTEDRRIAALSSARTARCVSAVMAVGGLIALWLAEPVIRYSVGATYVEAADAFRILVIGSVLSCFSMMLYPGLSSQGEARYGLRVFGPGTVVAAVLCWWLVPSYGVVGAAVAMAFAQGVVAISIILIYRHVFGIELHKIIIPQHEDLVSLAGFIRRKFGKPRKGTPVAETT
ncbi:MAG: polysaccharide biosynthesis C-terminal domain-containing protein [Geminicoccaceae bacterium]|nr:polysaccharide biosynthesis C-terminal domain-containing protein [Geminicoccaceae bacterium]